MTGVRLVENSESHHIYVYKACRFVREIYVICINAFVIQRKPCNCSQSLVAYVGVEVLMRQVT